ncbi:MAG: DUF711 family protein [Acidobacteriota bacterium]
MVDIRTVTVFANPGFPIDCDVITRAGRIAADLRAALQEAGFTVQTTRFASAPFPGLARPDEVVDFARELQARCLAHGFEYVTIGPARPGDPPGAFAAIPDALEVTTAAFASAVIATHERGIDLSAVRAAASIIHRNARIGSDGFANLRFAALANVPPGIPFLPASYHDGGQPVAALGVEGAPAAVLACQESPSLEAAGDRMVELVEHDASRMASVVERALAGGDARFGGIDFSLAPFPDQARSTCAAVERLMGGRTGDAGTVAAAAWLASTLDRARFSRAGFSGLFFPVFEDAVLAGRADQDLLTVQDLLLYSTVCGTGLDTVPLPGRIDEGAIAAILMDMAALALRLDKPLTARLMPIPGAREGDPVRFDFPFFAPSRVIDPRAYALDGLMWNSERASIEPRSR